MRTKRDPNRLSPSYKKDAIKTARDLHYPPSVIERIKSAVYNFEIAKIMIDARKEREKRENY